MAIDINSFTKQDPVTASTAPKDATNPSGNIYNAVEEVAKVNPTNSSTAKVVDEKMQDRWKNSKSDIPSDDEWVTNAFLLPDVAFNDVYYRQNRYATSADMKFGDTRPGGAIGINSRPQFTPYADPRRPGRTGNANLHVRDVNSSDQGYGYGRVWSEHHDDPQQKIYLRFGVPEFNSVANFLRRAFTYEEIVIARRGRTPSWLYDVGSTVGSLAVVRAFPVVAMGYMIFKGIDLIMSRPMNKYYSLKPAMHYYWSMVQTIINTIMVNRGVMPKILKDRLGGNNTQIVGRPYTVNSDMLDYFSYLFPDFFRTETVGDTEVVKYFDVFAVATRAQRMANNVFLKEFEYLNNQGDIKDPSAFKGYLNRREDFVRNYLANSEKPSLLNMFRYYTSFAKGYGTSGDKSKIMNSSEMDLRIAVSADGIDLNNPNSASNSQLPQPTQQTLDDTNNNIYDDTPTVGSDQQRTEILKGKMDASQINSVLDKMGDEDSQLSEKKYLDGIQPPSFFKEFFTAMDAEFKDGGGFAVFCVDYTGSISESFSNSYTESSISSELNGLSAKAKDFRFKLGDGNIIGDTLQSVINGAADLAFGAAESMTLGISNLLLGIAGSGYIDIPKHWQDSSANLPRSNYSMTLISPYNNVFSHLINIYLPMAMLLAGAVPRSTGRSSYTGPYICQLFDRGRNQIQLGAIDNISFTRGTSNLGFSLDGKALAIEVSFSVIDLSSIMHMPMASGSILSGAAALGLDDDSIASNYLAVLAGQDMYSQIYALPRAVTRLAKISAGLGKVGSGYYWSSLAHEKLTNGGGLFLVTRPFARFYEMLNVGASTLSGNGPTQ